MQIKAIQWKHSGHTLYQSYDGIYTSTQLSVDFVGDNGDVVIRANYAAVLCEVLNNADPLKFMQEIKRQQKLIDQLHERLQKQTLEISNLKSEVLSALPKTTTPEEGAAQYKEWLKLRDELHSRKQPQPLINPWLQAGSLLYRLTDSHRPQNCDEITITMVDGSRNLDERAAAATRLLYLLDAKAVAQKDDPKRANLADKLEEAFKVSSQGQLSNPVSEILFGQPKPCVMGTGEADKKAEADFNRAQAQVMQKFFKSNAPLNLLAPGHLDEEIGSFWGRHFPPMMGDVYKAFANKVVKMFLNQVERQIKQQLIDDYRQSQRR